jgi:hypothetical protein
MSGYETQLFIENEIVKAGGRPRHVLCASAINIDSNLLVRARRKATLMENPMEDPVTRFLFWICGENGKVEDRKCESEHAHVVLQHPNSVEAGGQG